VYLSLSDSQPQDQSWDLLQQPAHPAEVEPRFRLLLAALDVGWRIEEPVYLRPRWSDDGPRVYHFILQLDARVQPRLITVPECAEVDHFVRHERLRVIAGKSPH
jgi:hypothetical protein